MKENMLNGPGMADSDAECPDFDFEFRPDYWAPANPMAVIMGNMVGELRRRSLEQAFREGDGAGLVLGHDDRGNFLSDERRGQLVSLHPCFSGGEFLPPYLDGELEIGRLVLNTPTLDVIAIRVLKESGRFCYRIVDEYGQRNFFHPPFTSVQPLTFGEFLGMVGSIQLHGAWRSEAFLDQVLEMNIREGIDPDSLKGFLTAKSYLYPQFGAWVAQRLHDWLDGYLQKEEDPDL